MCAHHAEKNKDNKIKNYFVLSTPQPWAIPGSTVQYTTPNSIHVKSMIQSI